MMRAKKSLGQNFLTRDHYAKVMCDAAEISKKDTVIEIGPGKGILTGVLLSRTLKVIAVEKDREFIGYLEEKFSKEIANDTLTILEQDILSYEPRGVYKVVANIPYYITGQILRNFLSAEAQPLSMTLMVQKEVAERACAKDGKESLLSLSVKAYGEPHIIAKVAAGNFQPKPKVDSAILHIGNISRKLFKNKEQKELFFALIRSGFSQKRKFLIGNLKNLKLKGLEKAFEASGIDAKARAEDVPLSQWMRLVENAI